MKSIFTFSFFFFFVLAMAFAQQTLPKRVYFEFITNGEIQSLAWDGDTEQLDSIFINMPQADSLLVANLPIQVDSYCGALSSRAENLAQAEASAQVVMEQLMQQKQLTPAHFATRFISEPYKDDDEAVVVRIEIFQITESLFSPHQ